MNSAEVRVPRNDEMIAYYRALPGANGLPQWEPFNAAWHGGSAPWPPPSRPASDEQMAEWAREDVDDPTFHPIGTFIGDSCVGATAAISLEVTVPGGSVLPMAGVTGTGVIATHRRRGYLRRMMQAMFDAARDRSEPLAMLSASEGSIYGNFGFSPTTHRTRWEIARHEARLLPGESDGGSLALIDATTAKASWPNLHAAVRARRVGELTPLTGHWDGLSDTADGTDGPLRFLLRRDAYGVVDGLAHFRLPWAPTEEDAGMLVVEALEATSPAAYRSMWQLLLDFDLTKTVVAAGRPRDEPLRWMLANPRAMRVTRQSDNLWARILDVPIALSGRSYGADGALTIRVVGDEMCPDNARTWEVEASEGRSSCTASTRAPDLTVPAAVLGPLFFGGVSPHPLAAAGRIEAQDHGVLERAAKMLLTTAEPHNSFGF